MKDSFLLQVLFAQRVVYTRAIQIAFTAAIENAGRRPPIAKPDITSFPDHVVLGNYNRSVSLSITCTCKAQG